MQQFKQSESTAAYRRIYMFLASAADGYTPITTLAGATVNLFRNGVAFGTQPATPASLTHISAGHWYYEIPILPINYLSDLGILTITVQDANIRTVVLSAQVVSYDWTTTPGITAADVWAYTSRTLTGSVTVSGNVTVGGFTSGAISSSAFASGAITSSTIANSAITLRLSNDAVASNARFTTYDTFAGYPLLSSTPQHQVLVTGSHHAAADVHAFQTNVITSDATDASFVTEIQTGITAPTVTDIADGILARNLDSSGNGGDATNERTVRSALRAMRNKVVVTGGSVTVYKEDDATTAWTGSVSNITDVTVNPTGGS
jgi:hypothetical protein